MDIVIVVIVMAGQGTHPSSGLPYPGLPGSLKHKPFNVNTPSEMESGLFLVSGPGCMIGKHGLGNTVDIVIEKLPGKPGKRDICVNYQ